MSALIEEVVRQAANGDPGGGPALHAGDVVGRYQLVREVGRGGFGIVWEARDRDLGRTVAFKILRANGEPARERRLIDEAEIAARLAHPNIVTVLDVGRWASGAFLVQEFLRGASLAKRLEDGPLPLPEAVRTATAIARGLAHAHSHGVVHRDLTPGNVLLCEDGQVKLLDLGMASALGRKKLEGGTRTFMSPEQASGAPEDERSDVFALGVVLYRMLVGASPFSASGPAGTRGAARGLHIPAAPDLGKLIEAMLALAPTDRPRDAAAVLGALEAVGASLPAGVAGGIGRVRVRAPARTRWLITGGALGFVAAALVAAPFLLGSRGSLTGKAGELVVVGASAANTTCNWGMHTWVSLAEALPAGSSAHGGKMGKQGVGEVQGRKAWLMQSDWNAIFVPLPEWGEHPSYAVEVEFFAPALTTYPRGVRLMAFTDARSLAPGSAPNDHGCGVAAWGEPGRAGVFAFSDTADQDKKGVVYRGLLPVVVTGAWHKLRVEGARDGTWFRALIDGIPLFNAFGRCDLAGKSVQMSTNYGFLNPEDVAFSNLRFFYGTADCR